MGNAANAHMQSEELAEIERVILPIFLCTTFDLAA